MSLKTKEKHEAVLGTMACIMELGIPTAKTLQEYAIDVEKAKNDHDALVVLGLEIADNIVVAWDSNHPSVRKNEFMFKSIVEGIRNRTNES